MISARSRPKLIYKNPLPEILTYNPSTKIPTNRLRKKLIDKGILFNQCYTCGLQGLWNGKPINLQLVHLDNDSCNNIIENLIVQCPNCFSQLKSKQERIFIDTCEKCLANVPQKKRVCRVCFNGGFFKGKNPGKITLKKELIKHGFKTVQKKYGISKAKLVDWLHS